MSCKECPHSPKNYEEYCIGESCVDAFTDKAKNCGSYNKYKPVKPTRFYSSKQEKAVAKKVGGKQTVNSGATKFEKGDVTTDRWLLECKTNINEKSSFAIKKSWLEKNKQETFSMGKQHNALVFDFGPSADRYYVVDEKTFLKMKIALDLIESEDKKQ